jgi:hypothetical protein
MQPHLTGHQILIVPIFFRINNLFRGLRQSPNLEFIPSPNLSQLNTKQDKAFKRTANNADTPYHKATHSELLKQNKQLRVRVKLPHLTGHQILIVPIFFVSIIFFGV